MSAKPINPLNDIHGPLESRPLTPWGFTGLSLRTRDLEAGMQRVFVSENGLSHEIKGVWLFRLSEVSSAFDRCGLLPLRRNRGVTYARANVI